MGINITLSVLAILLYLWMIRRESVVYYINKTTAHLHALSTTPTGAVVDLAEDSHEYTNRLSLVGGSIDIESDQQPSSRATTTTTTTAGVGGGVGSSAEYVSMDSSLREDKDELKNLLEEELAEEREHRIVLRGESEAEIKKSRGLRSILRQLLVPVFVQFFCLFVSLVVWPGLPCSSPKSGWFADGGEAWFCSPFIIAAFNYGDVIGRGLASYEWVLNALSLQRCLWFSLIRAAFIPIIALKVITSSPLLIVVVLVIGFTNGIVCTVTMMKGPLLVEPQDRERAAYIMVAALYAGIAGGSILAAAAF
eukprot:gnl/Spiro4/3581_TR1761_c0_g1_i1.p1 gnl/Spiro4/3581_TR1761_c0_g1~~gnl/Spiro4/3581_TR1761_c0_g1_i1.p1  ORF type:complete len:308 (+),score=102.99 gnl/Spiro4/3581_TR1761_c0_g1_i1:617-1540(+)